MVHLAVQTCTIYEMSEFSIDKGIWPNPGRGAITTPYQRLVATRLTDPGNPDASEENILNGTATQSHQDENGVYVPGDLREDVTNPITETPALPAGGIINPQVYNPGHDPEGMQDGEGKAWRDSISPNPKW